MKNNHIIFLFGLIAAILMGFSSCEEEVIDQSISLEDYKYDFGMLVSSEKEIVQNTTKGYNAGQIYASDSVFNLITGSYLDSLDVADSIIAIPEVTFEELFYANFAITQAGRTFHGEVFIADKRALNELIHECDTLRKYTPVGEASGEVSFVADSTFGAAISRAKIVRDDGANTEFSQAYKRIQRQVDAQLDSLNAEFGIYKAAIN